MVEIISKSELARRLDVEPAAVSAWLKRGKISAPAVLPNGRINFELALAQLRKRLDPARSTTALNGQLPSRILDYGERITLARCDLLQLRLDRQKLLHLVSEGRLSRVADFNKALMGDLTQLVVTVDGQLSEWVAIIRSSASDDVALSALEAQLDRLKVWVRP